MERLTVTWKSRNHHRPDGDRRGGGLLKAKTFDVKLHFEIILGMADTKHLIDRRGIQCSSHVNSVADLWADFCCQHGLKMILKWKMWRFTVIKTKGFSLLRPCDGQCRDPKNISLFSFKCMSVYWRLSSRAVAARQKNRFIVEFVILVFK